MTINQVIRLLQRSVPNEECTSAALARLEAVIEPIDWPTPETSYDDDLLTSATMLFLQPARAVRAKHALRIALGGEKFELLVGFLTFVRSAHTALLPASRLRSQFTSSFTNMTMLEPWCLTVTFLIFVSRSRLHPAVPIGHGRLSSMPIRSQSPLTWQFRSHLS
jgi:hypothetical protein